MKQPVRLNKGQRLRLVELETRSNHLEQMQAKLIAENATRVPCGHCCVPVLPCNLARHEAMHEEDDT